VKNLLWLAAVTLIVTGCTGGNDQTGAATPSTTAFVAKADAAGGKKEFTRQELKQAAGAFRAECSKCHVGGQTYGTYNVKEINLSLGQLQGANPPLDNIQSLVSYMKKPLSYDGTENLYNDGRHPKFEEIPEEQLTLIAAHILKEANFNPSWGRGKDVR
jgi:photosystem II cytochrome c550